MGIVFELLCYALWLYLVVLVVRIIFSWVPSVPEPVMPLARVSRQLTDPVLQPLRGMLPPLQTGAMAIDFSPIIVFIAVRLLIGLVCPLGTP